MQTEEQQKQNGEGLGMMLGKGWSLISCVEAFATKIKIESSNHSPFLGANQEFKVTSELLKLTDQERTAVL